MASTDVDGGGVALLSSAGVRSVFYASNDVSMALEALQIDFAEGPCVDAGTNRSPVLVEDLRDPRDGVAQRWPFFLPGADALGVRGLFAFPLRIGSIVLGTLELHRATAGELRRPQLSFALRSARRWGPHSSSSGPRKRSPPSAGRPPSCTRPPAW